MPWPPSPQYAADSAAGLLPVPVLSGSDARLVNRVRQGLGTALYADAGSFQRFRANGTDLYR